ncbi:PREDICTED: uncharacterized protein LOC109182900 [Ipomoea nil]|uniref:uncharacterized protein LOC109182900 n=1 Tax=Ipomoea nil TaxID=35883 RepID=UPI000900DEAA|nr:PREDICTED: uncharacterized protein LOC109182900 [Ipomoea nil]XP_019188687.1 PREDICTED: uncharacterized protein LOC109182900 [Ipomoea nil]XP_019188688.1 PREDICTED: uncharacterized protein LOC109182900 [Ipomoea nil]XP_019188690.1 PREDICTED: uncharacterized protein LOC109182900 [Ipomoea nil]
MGVKVAITCLHWSKPSAAQSPSSSHALTTPTWKRRNFTSNEGGLTWRCVHNILNRSAVLGPNSMTLFRSFSTELPKRRARTLTRSCSDTLDSFSDEEFSKKIQELALRFQLSGDEYEDSDKEELVGDSRQAQYESSGSMFLENRKVFDPLEPPDWVEREEIIPEWKANSVDLPFSLRIIRRKKQWEEGFREEGELELELASCSVKRAFSNMVFIIRELHSYTLQMREMLCYEDLQGVLVRVQKEMHASFVWLFQQVFSRTPTLMVYVMILLANYSVHSMAMAGGAPPIAATEEAVSVMEDQTNAKQKFDSSSIKTFSVSSSNGKTTSIGGSNGGGGKFRPTKGATDDDGGTFNWRRVTIGGEESVSGQVSREEELRLWNSIEEEASRLQSELRDEGLDHETMLGFVSPINAKIESDDYTDYFRTELLYQTGLAQEPNNTLLLANYAQFLFLIAQDYDRAEEYFKRAAEVEPKDAEALNKYATFLWQARNDLWAAEQTYQAAMDADPNNPFYPANYAHFLWNTGGEDTCFPLDNNG